MNPGRQLLLDAMNAAPGYVMRGADMDRLVEAAGVSPGSPNQVREGMLAERQISLLGDDHYQLHPFFRTDPKPPEPVPPGIDKTRPQLMVTEGARMALLGILKREPLDAKAIDRRMKKRGYTQPTSLDTRISLKLDGRITADIKTGLWRLV